ncbi:MAG: CYTH domain-containing protein [Phormidesmis sp.]
MAQEIERKFLVVGNRWRDLAVGKPYCQGYIATARAYQSVRVRIAGEQGYLTIKGPVRGLSRAEFEYAIPVADAQEMLETLCERPFIQKMRYRLPVGDVVWEIDEFEGENVGLIVAEVELRSEDQPFERPEWLGAEVSGQARYYNASLVKHPYSQWS